MSLNCRTRVAREQIPTQRCIDDAKNCLKTVEERYEAEIREAPGQRIQLFVAKSDLAFRQKIYQVAQEYCVNALALAEESGFLLEIKGIKDRDWKTSRDLWEKREGEIPWKFTHLRNAMRILYRPALLHQKKTRHVPQVVKWRLSKVITP